MTEMSRAQRIAILDFHNGVTAKVHTMLVRSARTLDVMVANGWAARVTAHTGNVTTAGLIAAGVDMDALHDEASEANGAFDRTAAKYAAAMVEVRVAQHAEACLAYDVVKG